MRYASSRKLFRPLTETLARKRFRALSAIKVWRRPVGVSGKEWTPHAARSVYRNGHQARRRADQFQIMLFFCSATSEIAIMASHDGRRGQCQGPLVLRMARKFTFLQLPGYDTPGRGLSPRGQFTLTGALMAGCRPRSSRPAPTEQTSCYAGMTSGGSFRNCATTAGSRLKVAATISGGVCASQSDNETSSYRSDRNNARNTRSSDPVFST